MYRIGVDVGGTNTDAALLDVTALDSPGRGVLASYKSSTTPDITSGIEAAIAAVLRQSGVAADQDKLSRLLSVTVGTTHFINALVEADARRLARVAVVRLCGPFTREIPPLSDFPVGLRRVLDGGVTYLGGGLEIDGREIAPLDEEAVRAAARDIARSGVGAVALVGVFASMDHAGAHERRCREVMLEAVAAEGLLAPGDEFDVVCSGEIGGPGLLERENATVLNAAVLRTARRAIAGFRRAMARLGLAACPLYLSQNDGTLIEAAAAAEFPIKTFASGPTNSMTGAAFLAGLDKPHSVAVAEGALGGGVGGGGQEKQGEEGGGERGEPPPQVLVVDIGGTTTDVCALLPSGFPRQAPGFVEVGGVRTAFSMPEVKSIGLGGGSKVVVAADEAAGEVEVEVGPASVGHYLTTQARVFGGPTLTATDIAVATGKVTEQLGDASLVADLPPQVVSKARLRIKKMLEAVVDEMKVSAAPVHVLLVGGGSVLLAAVDGDGDGGEQELEGVARCVRPPHHGAANAVGAAIARVAGEVDRMEILEGRDERAVLAEACAEAVERAVARGADRRTVQIVDVAKVPLQYVSNRATRIQVRAVGKLAVPDAASLAERQQQQQQQPGDARESAAVDLNNDDNNDDEPEGDKVPVPDALEPSCRPSLGVDLDAYRPEVRGGVWYPSEVDLELIGTGAGVLGTGGGGPTHHEFLKSVDALRRAGPGKMRVVDPSALRDADLVAFGAWYGAPSVSSERISGGNEMSLGIDTLTKIMGIESVAGIVSDEIGGQNGLSAFPTSVKYGIPVVDADGMGRAYPTMYHTTMYVYDQPICPVVLTDGRDNCSVVMNGESPARIETMLRTTAVELGLSCAVCARPLPGKVIKELAIPNTVSQAWYLGRAVHAARKNKTSYVDAIFDINPGKLLFTGKIADVQRDIGRGYTMGSVLIAPLSSDEREGAGAGKVAALAPSNPRTQHMFIPFQNEYLYAAFTDENGSAEGREVACTVPDLISILGQDGEAIGSQELRYGLRVNVIAMPAHPLWKMEKGLKVGGPENFKLDMPFVGVGEYTNPKSVIREFGSGV